MYVHVQTIEKLSIKHPKSLIKSKISFELFTCFAKVCKMFFLPFQDFFLTYQDDDEKDNC